VDRCALAMRMTQSRLAGTSSRWVINKTIYENLTVSSRAAATLAAVRRGLL